MGGKKHITKLILKADWIIHPDHMLDQEYQQYILLDAEQKFNKKIEEQKMENLSEIVFHFLNMNTLLTRFKLYDEKFIEYKSENINKFAVDFKRAKEMDPQDKKNINTFAIVNMAKGIFMNIFSKYTDLALKKMGNVKFIKRNVNLHAENVIYLLLRVSSCDSYDLWKIDINIDDTFGNIKRIDTFESKVDFKEDLKNFVTKFNAEEKTNPILEENTMIVTMDRADSHKDIVYMVRDMILFNKLFIGATGPMKESIFYDIKKATEEQKVFPYSLMLS